MCTTFSLLVQSSFVTYTVAPTITSFQRASSATHFTLTCTSTSSPATNVTWMRDDAILSVDGVKNQFYQTVTSRRNSTYQNTLVVNDNPEHVIGNYICSVTNKFGNSSSELTVRGKVVYLPVCVSVRSILYTYCTLILWWFSWLTLASTHGIQLQKS